MAKSPTARLTDTLDYMKGKLTPVQYKEVTELLAARRVDDIALSPNDDLAQEMSIGHKNPFRKAARRAKRSLILLALVFISQDVEKNAEVNRIKNLPDTGEAGLVEEMRSWFAKSGVTGQQIADLARQNITRMPKWANLNFFGQHAVRGVYDVNNPFNCYNACIFWAFQAGAISKRYLFNKLGSRDGNNFYDTFSRCGWDTVIEYQVTKGIPESDQSQWKTNRITDISNGGEVNIDAGLTVYFDQEPNKVFGHIACSLGDGTVISQNSVIPALWGEIGPSNWPASKLRRPKWDSEVDKMTQGITHILPIRYLLDLHFYPTNGYRKLRVTRGHFWEVFPLAER